MSMKCGKLKVTILNVLIGSGKIAASAQIFQKQTVATWHYINRH